MTTLAAPATAPVHRASEDFTDAASMPATAMAKALGITKYKGVYDFDLDPVRHLQNNNETFLEALDRC